MPHQSRYLPTEESQKMAEDSMKAPRGDPPILHHPRRTFSSRRLPPRPLEPHMYVPPTRDQVALNSFAMNVEQQQEAIDALLQWRDAVNKACHPELAQPEAPPSGPSIPVDHEPQAQPHSQEPHLHTPLPAPLDDELMDLSTSRKRSRDDESGDEDSSLPRKQITSSTPGLEPSDPPASHPESQEDNDALLDHQDTATAPTPTSQDHVSVPPEAAASPPSMQGAEFGQPPTQTSSREDDMEVIIQTQGPTQNVPSQLTNGLSAASFLKDKQQNPPPNRNKKGKKGNRKPKGNPRNSIPPRGPSITAQVAISATHPVPSVTPVNTPPTEESDDFTMAGIFGFFKHVPTGPTPDSSRCLPTVFCSPHCKKGTISNALDGDEDDILWEDESEKGDLNSEDISDDHDCKNTTS
ncbi:hypothetical protein HPB50_013830 [Hyalomma asiaticum]|uniref:Uncharacterized protein n=1 Tax=Hyalomma asiaticum TaxID=266040 RepID=A0ACB7SUI0_HYAAI|nr:hypothetical protein HPB50_013830 [Hyalomma asiaticum]